MFSRISFAHVLCVFVVIVAMLFQVGPAQALGSGTISGTVNDGSNNPLADVTLRAVLKSDGTEVTTAISAADGTFTLTGLPLDTALAVVTADGLFYNHVTLLDWAEAITLTGALPDRTGVDFILKNETSDTVEQLTFNTRVGRLLNDVKIRQAIAYGTDRSQLLYNAFLPNNTLGIIMHSMVTPGAWFQASKNDLAIYPYDPVLAKSILVSAGWVDTNADGIRDNGIAGPNHVELALDFVTTNAAVRTASANLFKDQMQAIGILINVTTYTGTFFFTDPASPLTTGDFDIAEFAWVLPWDDSLSSLYNTGDVANNGGYSNASLDGYYAAAQSAKVAGDQGTFSANALLWQKLISQDLPTLPLFTRNLITPVNVPVGTNINVTSGNATATYAHVTGAGWFGIAASKYNSSDLPAGYKQGDPNVYEVGSNALFDSAHVCINYDVSRMSTANEYFLKMFHLLPNGSWSDVTSGGSLDVLANKICGDFTSFSVVALMYDDSGGGSISGTVRDDVGTPITGMEMTVFAERPEGVLSQVNTDPIDGTYTLSGLPLNLDMRISATDNNNNAYGKQFYPEVALVSAATVFNLTVGTPAYSGINFALPAAHLGATIEHLTFNVRAGRVLNNLIIRRAIALGTDRGRMLAAFLNSGFHGVVLNSFAPAGYWSQPSYNQGSVYPYNPVLAKSILDAAGITDHNANGIRDIGGSDIVLDFKTTTAANRVASSSIFVANMASIGIRVVVTTVIGTDFFNPDPAISPLAAGNFDIAEFAWVGPDLNMDDAYPIGVYQTGNTQNYGGYSNATADAEYSAAFAATNRAEMLPHVLAYYSTTRDDMPSLPLFTRENVTPVDTLNGLNVLADLSAVGVTVRYRNATGSGLTAAFASEIHPGDLPANFSLVALYEIGSNVTRASGTGATVCLHYDDTGLSAAQESTLLLYHLTLSPTRTWANIFTTRDPAANQVCGLTTSFSTFAVLMPYNTAPTVLNILRASANPSNAAGVKFTVTFSEAVNGVDKTDFALVTTGGISKAAISAVSGSGATRTVTVATGLGSGTIQLNLIDNDSIKDLTLLSLGGPETGNGNFTTGDIFTVDKTKPVVTSIVRADADPTAAASVKFTVTFSKPVIGVDTKDFKLAITGALPNAIVTAVSGSGTTYTVTVSTGTGTGFGTLRLDLITNLTIKDTAMNVLATSFKTGQFYTVNKPPVVVSIVRASANPTKAATVKFTVKFSEVVTGVDTLDFAIFSTGLANTSIVSVTGSGITYTVTVNTGTGSGTLRLDLIDNDSIKNATLNPLGGAGLVNGDYKTGLAYNVR